MTEATAAILDFGFGHIDLVRVQTTIQTRNTASRRVVEKLGFTQEVILRSYQLVHGKRHDYAVYSLLADDLKPWRKE